MKYKSWCFAVLSSLVFVLAACSISYKFNGASIDYSKVKTITIKDFPNHAPMVYPPLAQQFTEGLKDIYVRQTRLSMVNDNGDLELEGEITGYELAALAVKEDALSSPTRILNNLSPLIGNLTAVGCCRMCKTSCVRKLWRSWQTRFIMRQLPTGKFSKNYECS